MTPLKIGHFHIPGEATLQRYTVYLIVARHRKKNGIRLYVGKTGDNRKGCNPIISRAGNHLSFNPIHSQSRNYLKNPGQFDFDFFYAPFGKYIDPEKSRNGIDLINEMERQLNQMAQIVAEQKGLGKIENPYEGKARISRKEREKRAKLVTPQRLRQLEQLIETVSKRIDSMKSS